MFNSANNESEIVIMQVALGKKKKGYSIGIGWTASVEYIKRDRIAKITWFKTKCVLKSENYVLRIWKTVISNVWFLQSFVCIVFLCYT